MNRAVPNGTGCKRPRGFKEKQWLEWLLVPAPIERVRYTYKTSEILSYCRFHKMAQSEGKSAHLLCNNAAAWWWGWWGWWGGNGGGEGKQVVKEEGEHTHS
jgi:hypothetical protein